MLRLQEEENSAARRDRGFMFMTQENPVWSSTPAFSPERSRMLQRKCSCGGSSSSGGECEACEKKTLQRRTAGSSETATAPPIVHDVLRSPGQPLDRETRAFMEPRFGHDFGKVRLHTDAQANESAQSVNALAYTVGPQIVFGAGPYQPGAASDTELLAHELTHVVQQSQAQGNPSSLRVGEIDSPFEKEADRIANAVVSNQPSAPPVHTKTPALQRQPAQTPAQAPAQAAAEPIWGAKKWPGSEAEWNAFHQLAIQGLAGSKLKPEKVQALAVSIADLSMVHCTKHGKQSKCAENAASDEQSRKILNISLTWGEGSKGVWGETFRSALQSTTGGVDGPISANEAVQRAEDIADQAARGFIGEALWKVYMNCKVPDASSSPAPAPKAAAPGGH
jgi:hypothetical protein